MQTTRTDWGRRQLYIFHRVTGVGLFGYLLLHIISTALILLGPEIYEGAEAIYKNFYFRVAEIGLMAAVLGHACLLYTSDAADE